MTIKIAKFLSIFYAGLFTIFALISGTESTTGIKGILLNLPNVAPWLLCWVAIFIAWRKPKIGGVLFLILAGASTIFFQTYLELIPFLIISLPLVIIGGLFMKSNT